MTPEERARAVVESFTGDEYWIDTTAAIVSVADVIRDAVRAERAACVQALMAVSNAYEPGISKDGYDAYKHAIANGIAAIRARED